ncbi:MAG: flagella basal body P-ring formation protein FlgA [Deltaproteobacteria bacterium]|nr:flagella basal body P-ring formation protein FlgA [Deltaproteobacteria bacterium]
MIALVLSLLAAAPAPAPLDEAVRAEVRALIGDAHAEVVVHEVRVGDRQLTRGDFVVELARGEPRRDRAVRVRGKVRAGDRSTWLSATIEVRGTGDGDAAATVGRPTGPVIVDRGARVTARVSDRHFRVSAEAEALSPGRLHERVTVRVVASGKTLDGRVVAPGLVELGAEVAP